MLQFSFIYFIYAIYSFLNKLYDVILFDGIFALLSTKQNYTLIDILCFS